jgi:hypothetical protein
MLKHLISQKNQIIEAVKEGKTALTSATPVPVPTRRSSGVAWPLLKVWQLAATHGLPFGTIQAILADGLAFVKKSARRVPKLLSKKEASGVQRQLPRPHMVALICGPEQYSDHG